MYYYRKEPGGSVYISIVDSTTITSAPTSLFRLKAGPNNRVIIDEIHVGRADGDPQGFGVYVYRGSTTPLSTAYNQTPAPMAGWANHPAAASQVNILSTILPSTASAVLLDADTSDGYRYEYNGWGDLELVPGQVLDVVGINLQTVSTTADIHAVMRFRETAKNPRD